MSREEEIQKKGNRIAYLVSAAIITVLILYVVFFI